MEGHNSRFNCLQFDQAIEFIITLIANGGKLEGTSVSFDNSNVSDAGSVAVGKGTTQAVLEAIIKNAISKVEFIEGESKFRITRLDGTHRDIEISIPSSAADVTYQNNTEQTSATNVQSAITDLFTKIENIKPIGGSGVTPEQIKQAVQEWLSAHPEATIPDGSVTFDKFANEVKNRPVLNVRGDDYSNGVPEFLLGTGGGTNILDVLGNGGIKVLTSTVGGRKAIVIDATGVKAGLTDEDRNKLNKIDGLETSVQNAVQKTEELNRLAEELAMRTPTEAAIQGWSVGATNLLFTILSNAAYIKDQSANIQALKRAILEGGGEVVEPDDDEAPQGASFYMPLVKDTAEKITGLVPVYDTKMSIDNDGAEFIDDRDCIQYHLGLRPKAVALDFKLNEEVKTYSRHLVVVGNNSSVSVSVYLGIYLTGATLGATYLNNDTTLGAVNIETGWHRLSAGEDGEKLIVCIDGKKIAERNTTPYSFATEYLYLGNNWRGVHDNGTRVMGGNIKNVAVYNNFLTEEEILNNSIL